MGGLTGHREGVRAARLASRATSRRRRRRTGPGPAACRPSWAQDPQGSAPVRVRVPVPGPVLGRRGSGLHLGPSWGPEPPGLVEALGREPGPGLGRRGLERVPAREAAPPESRLDTEGEVSAAATESIRAEAGGSVQVVARAPQEAVAPEVSVSVPEAWGSVPAAWESASLVVLGSASLVASAAEHRDAVRGRHWVAAVMA